MVSPPSSCFHCGIGVLMNGPGAGDDATAHAPIRLPRQCGLFGPPPVDRPLHRRKSISGWVGPAGRGTAGRPKSAGHHRTERPCTPLWTRSGARPIGGRGSVEASGDGRRAFRVGPLTAAFLSALWFRRNRGRTRAISRRGARARLRGGSDGRGRGALNGTFCQRLTRSGVFCSARLPASVSTAGTRSSGLPG